MEIEKAPPGQRITKLSFHLAAQKAVDGMVGSQLERFEFTACSTASGEEIGSLWCEITPYFMTVTVMIAPRGHQSESMQIMSALSALSAATSPDEATKEGAGKGRKIGHNEMLTDAVVVLLSRAAASANSIERRQTIYKISEIVGAIEMTGYFPLLKSEDMMRVSGLSKA